MSHPRRLGREGELLGAIIFLASAAAWSVTARGARAGGRARRAGAGARARGARARARRAGRRGAGAGAGRARAGGRPQVLFSMSMEDGEPGEGVDVTLCMSNGDNWLACSQHIPVYALNSRCSWQRVTPRHVPKPSTRPGCG